MEAELIAGVRAGDWVAFETIYRAYWPRLIAFGREYGGCSKHDAQEVVQEVFLSIWQNRRAWEVHAGLDAYLFGAMRNRVKRIRHLRPLRLRQALRASVDNSGEHRPIIGELTATINAIVRDMPARCRDVYRLRYTEGLDTRAIAEELSLAIPTVKRHHARALHLLAEGLATTEWAELARRVLRGTTYGAPESHDDQDA